MFKLIKVKSVVRIPPDKFGRPLDEVSWEELRKEYEGALTSNAGLVVAILDVKVNEYGRIIHGDGATYHDVEFTALTFDPFLKEVVEGEVLNVTESGIFIDLGPLDGFIYIGQVSDERAEYDSSRQALLLKGGKKTIEKGDVVKARIYNIGLQPGKGLRIQLTMRQVGLGKVEKEE
ncbi:DNA-directed RNA polymerase [Thermogladius sp.]|mgnify:FL=1|uniref:DNA-directed RNA polymerase n=1 Tax=unclassified Thermogladius TaxID=2647734 RepID=UPI003D11A744